MIKFNELSLLLVPIGFIILSQFELKYIILSLIVLYLIYYYIINSETGEQSDSYKIQETLEGLHNYENINRIEYRYGNKYWNLFLKKINKLQNNEYDYPNFEYDNCKELLNTSIKHFKSLYLKENDSDLKILIDTLYNKGHLSLKNISIKLNKDWTNNPNTLSKEIIYDSPSPYNVSFI